MARARFSLTAARRPGRMPFCCALDSVRPTRIRRSLLFLFNLCIEFLRHAKNQKNSPCRPLKGSSADIFPDRYFSPQRYFSRRHLHLYFRLRRVSHSTGRGVLAKMSGTTIRSALLSVPTTHIRSSVCGLQQSCRDALVRPFNPNESILVPYFIVGCVGLENPPTPYYTNRRHVSTLTTETMLDLRQSRIKKNVFFKKKTKIIMKQSRRVEANGCVN